MTRTITLDAKTTGFDYDKSAEGFTTVTRPSVYRWDGELKVESYEQTLLPELGPKQVIKGNGPLVMEIKGRRFRVIFEEVHPEGFYLDESMPQPGRVTFIEVDPDTPLTETEVFDAEDVTRSRLFNLRDQLETTLKYSKQEGMDDFWKDAIQRIEDEIAEYEAKVEHKDWSGYQPTQNSIFGQPSFLQNEIMPVVDGRAAFHLATFETGWGDSGNENYLVALDAEGYPCAVFWEASCC